MREQRKDEPRIDYLAKVLYAFMESTGAGAYVMEYDGATCDGCCIAQEIVDELDVDIDS